MTEKMDPPAPVQSEIAGIKLSETGSAQAPFVYFDNASAFGHLNGVVQIALEAARMVPDAKGDGVVVDRVITAHLRMNIPAARSLKHAIEGVLLMVAPAGSETKN